MNEGSKTSYAKSITILGLIGGLTGMGIQQAIVSKPSIGSTALGTLVGVMGTLIPYGIYLRTGGKDFWRNPAAADEPLTFAGLVGRLSTHEIYGGGGLVEDVARAAGA